MDLPWNEVVLNGLTDRQRSNQENFHADEQQGEGRYYKLRQSEEALIRPAMLGIVHGGMPACRINTHVLVLLRLERPIQAAFGNATP